MTSPSYRGYRFPPEIIGHAVWLYHRFCLSFRDAEDLLAQRRVTVTYETIRQWCRIFGPAYARTLRRRRGRMGDTWYLDELFVNIHGRQQYLWRAVDEDGDVRPALTNPCLAPRARVTSHVASSNMGSLRSCSRPPQSNFLGGVDSLKREIVVGDLLEVLDLLRVWASLLRQHSNEPLALSKKLIVRHDRQASQPTV